MATRHLTWTCQDCGTVNACGDTACECEHEAERRQKALLDRLDYLREEHPDRLPGRRRRIIHSPDSV